MPRQARLDAPGALQHVIARGIERRAIFSEEEDCLFFTNRLGKLLNDTGTDCFAWVLIHNHFHLLLKTGPTPLASLMRRLLTSYSVHYNRRYQRSGHLFQNRYRSLVCDEDTYLLELVRYIHLNPIRSGIVKDLEELERYPWCGDGVLMGRSKASWQNSDEVLSYFGERIGAARLKYRRFLREGLSQGKRPDLVGGGLIQSREGGKEKEPEEEQFYDRRVLGETEFVKQILQRHQDIRETRPLRMTWQELLEKVSQWSNVPTAELLSRTKRASVARARSIVSYLAVRSMGMKTTEVAGLLNLTQPAVSRSLLRGEEILKESEEFDDLLKKL